MMTAIFAVLTVALLSAWGGWRRTAIAFALVCLALTTGLFLWEVYSPDYGFRMPWIQTERHAPAPAGREA